MPHLRDGFIAAKVGIEQSSTLLFLPLSWLLFLLFLFVIPEGNLLLLLLLL